MGDEVWRRSGAAAARQVRRPRRRHLDGLAVGADYGAQTGRAREAAARGARLPARQLAAAARAARDEIERHGGRVLIDRPAVRLELVEGGIGVVGGAQDSWRRGHDPRSFEAAGPPERYDAVVATVPNDVFMAVLSPELKDRIGRAYLERLALDRVPHRALPAARARPPVLGYYWTNIADPELPFVGLIEHTNLVEPERYGGRRFLYVANYVAPDDPLLDLGHDELLDRLRAGPAASQPGHSTAPGCATAGASASPRPSRSSTVGYRERIPPLQTGVPGLVLANTTQIYPEDRGTNYSVELGDGGAPPPPGPSLPLAPAGPRASPPRPPRGAGEAGVLRGAGLRCRRPSRLGPRRADAVGNRPMGSGDPCAVLVTPRAGPLAVTRRRPPATLQVGGWQRLG